jgi:hypothetical protein
LVIFKQEKGKRKKEKGESQGRLYAIVLSSRAFLVESGSTWAPTVDAFPCKLRHCERSEAIQTHSFKSTGLLFRCAPRNDAVLRPACLPEQPSRPAVARSSFFLLPFSFFQSKRECAR